MRLVFAVLLVLIVAAGVLYITQTSDEVNTSTSAPTAGVKKNETKIMGVGDHVEVMDAHVVAENLDTPWGIVFPDDQTMLVTERPGRALLINRESGEVLATVLELNQGKELGESGLLGIELHPDFDKNKFVYIYYTYSSNGSNTLNKVSRFKFENNKMSDEEVLIDEIPGAVYHDGGRMKFGPDGYLYITTGDANQEDLAQEIGSLAGKILRMTDKGESVQDNPFNNMVYSYGHRNPQGIAWDKDGNLWSTEHGRSGVLSGLDEVNLVEIGKNYGWPAIEGDEAQDGMIVSKRHSGASSTWAPASAEIVGSSLFFGGLRGEALYEAVLDGKEVVDVKEHFKNEFGRIRDVVLGPDGDLYITTSNRDGRGSPRDGDDRIIRVEVSN